MSFVPTTTWDGVPVSSEKPHGAAVVVYRYVKRSVEVLIMHRAHHGPDYEGDWAWTPPSGARQPGEVVDEVVKRELKEETGLEDCPVMTDFGTADWYVYALEVGLDVDVQLDAEHDRFEWVALEEAMRRCQPETVSQQLQRFALNVGGKS